MPTTKRFSLITLGWQTWAFLAVVLFILLALTGFTLWVG